MAWQIFVSCSTWHQDLSKVEPVRKMVRKAGHIPYTLGIDEKVKEEMAFKTIAHRIRESQGMVVIHTRRYLVNGHIASVWLQREPIIATMERKPIIEFYEVGTRSESLMEEISINQIEVEESEFSTAQGKYRIRRWIDHFLWHVDQNLRSWTNLTVPLLTIAGLIGGGLITRKPLGVIGGGGIGLAGGIIAGEILDSFKPLCEACPRTYPPKLWE